MAEATVVTPVKGGNTKYWVIGLIFLILLGIGFALWLGVSAIRDNNKAKDDKIASLEKDLTDAKSKKCEGCVAKPKATHIPTHKKNPRAARPTQPAQPVQVERVRLVEVNPFKKMEEACRGKTMVRHPDGTIECNTPQQFVQQAQQPVCNPPNRWSQGPIQGKVRCLTAEDYAAMYAPRQQVVYAQPQVAYVPQQQYVPAPQPKAEEPWCGTGCKILIGTGIAVAAYALGKRGSTNTVVVQGGGPGVVTNPATQGPGVATANATAGPGVM